VDPEQPVSRTAAGDAGEQRHEPDQAEPAGAAFEREQQGEQGMRMTRSIAPTFLVMTGASTGPDSQELIPPHRVQIRARRPGS
jgi:hypothetical protein